MLLSGSSEPSRISFATSLRRVTTSRPRSSRMLRTPRSSSPSAQNRPAGPVPMISGQRSGSFTRGSSSGGGGASPTSGGSRPGLRPGPSSTSSV